MKLLARKRYSEASRVSPLPGTRAGTTWGKLTSRWRIRGALDPGRPLDCPAWLEPRFSSIPCPLCPRSLELCDGHRATSSVHLPELVAFQRKAATRRGPMGRRGLGRAFGGLIQQVPVPTGFWKHKVGMRPLLGPAAHCLPPAPATPALTSKDTTALRSPRFRSGHGSSEESHSLRNNRQSAHAGHGECPSPGPALSSHRRPSHSTSSGLRLPSLVTLARTAPSPAPHRSPRGPRGSLPAASGSA